MIELNLDRIRGNVQKAATEDLLDRATVFRGEMEPEALTLIDAELINRGVTVEQLQAHIDGRKDVMTRADGTVIKCSFCYRPAISQEWGWHKLFGWLPILPRIYSRCHDHASTAGASSAAVDNIES